MARTKQCDICGGAYDMNLRRQGELNIHSSESLVTRRFNPETKRNNEIRYLLCPVCAGKIFGFIDQLKGE